MRGTARRTATDVAAATSSAASPGQPTLNGERVTVRGLQRSDASSLFALLTTPEVSRFVSPPPPTIEAFAQFIERVNQQGRNRENVCLAVTLRGHDTAIGLFQIREIEPDSRTIEWGFALGSPFWGTGVFEEAASLVLAFIFDQLGAHRVEARAAARNARGGRALQKLGAAPEGVLRRALLLDGQYVDQVLYAIVEDDWRASRSTRASVPPIH